MNICIQILIFLVFIVLYTEVTKAQEEQKNYNLIQQHEIKETELIRVDPKWKLYKNIWYHQGQFYAISSKFGQVDFEKGLSVNSLVRKIPIKNIEPFIQNLEAYIAPGVTQFIDYPFPLYFDYYAHWLELLLPTYSVHNQKLWSKYTTSQRDKVDRIFMINTSQTYITDWVWQMLHIVFHKVLPMGSHPSAPIELPYILDKTKSQGLKTKAWYCFQDLLVVQDRYSHRQFDQGYPTYEHGDAWDRDGCYRYVNYDLNIGFENSEEANEFKEYGYKRFGMQPQMRTLTQENTNQSKQQSHSPLPRQITFLFSTDKESIANKEDLIEMLYDLGDQYNLTVRPIQLSSYAPFVSHADTMRRTGLLLSRHSALTASSIFLPKGALVYELLPFNWGAWANLNQIQKQFLEKSDEIQYQQWRAPNANYTIYQKPEDQRYSTWSYQECKSKTCLNVHAKAQLIVDIPLLQKELYKIIKKKF